MCLVSPCCNQVIDWVKLFKKCFLGAATSKADVAVSDLRDEML